MEDRLNLTAAQKQKLQALRQKNRQQMQALRTANLTPEQRRTRMQALRESQRNQFLSILTPAQQARMKAMQAEGRARFEGERGADRGRRQAMMLQRMKEQLNLTLAQENKIKAIMKSAEAQEKQLRAKRKPTEEPTPEQRTQMRTLRQNTMAQIQNVLTDTQRQKARQMMGERGPGFGGRGPGERRGPGEGRRAGARP